MGTHVAFLHVDVDSPKKLMQFWGDDGTSAGGSALDRFYEIAMGRALETFASCDVEATFFCVGEELSASTKAREMVRVAFDAGHEIANHTYSHTYGLTKLSREALRDEIERCSKIIHDITGTHPVGFRAPGYDINTAVVNQLEELGFAYDSSAFWTVLTPLIKWYHRAFSKGDVHSGFGDNSYWAPRRPYFPSSRDWKVEGESRQLVELPVPRTSLFQLPFYNNFHLSTGEWFRRIDVSLMRQRHLVYLFHLIEFCDLSDGLPPELAVHPNVKIPTTEKIVRIKDTIDRMKRRYRIERTDRFVRDYHAASSHQGAKPHPQGTNGRSERHPQSH